jgi:hypothetical protein
MLLCKNLIRLISLLFTKEIVRVLLASDTKIKFYYVVTITTNKSIHMRKLTNFSVVSFSIALLVCMSLSSCKKNNTYAIPGITAVEITFLNPVNGGTFNVLETLSIDGRIDADAKMGGWRVQIKDLETDEIVDEFIDMYEQTQFTIHHHWFPTVSPDTPIEIIVDALDNGQQILGTKSITLTSI